MASLRNLKIGNMGMGGRIAYLLTAWMLFSLGVAFLFFFQAFILTLLGLFCFFGAAILVAFSVRGMTYTEWKARRKARNQ